MEVLEQLGVDWRLLLAQLANFAILFYLLRRFAYKPVLRALDARRERIESAEEKARHVEEQTLALEEEKDEILESARKQSSEIIEEAKVDAKKQQERIVAQAHREKEKIEEEGRKQVMRERDSLRRELKEEMGDVVAIAVRKTVSDFADEQITKQLTDEALRILNTDYSHTS